MDCASRQPDRSREAVTGWIRLPGGAPANVACALVKLGTPAAFVGAVGQDRWGHALMQLMQDMAVESRGMQVTHWPTREVYIQLDEWGERTFTGFSSPHPEGFADAHLMANRLDFSLLDNSRYLVIGTLGLAYSETGLAIERCLRQVASSHIRVLMDLNWRPVFWPQPTDAPDRIRAVLPQVSFLKLAAEEAEWLFETTDSTEIARQNPHLLGVLVTAGTGNCSYWLQGNSGTVSGFGVDIEDPAGAGDAFVAGFLHQLCRQGIGCLQSRTVAHEIVTYACAVGALTTTRAGAIAAQPTPQEVDAFLYLNAHRSTAHHRTPHRHT